MEVYFPPWLSKILLPYLVVFIFVQDYIKRLRKIKYIRKNFVMKTGFIMFGDVPFQVMWMEPKQKPDELQVDMIEIQEEDQ